MAADNLLDTNTEPSILNGPETPDAPQPTTLPPATVNRTAAFATLANTPIGNEPPGPDVINQMQQAYQGYQQTIKAAGEDSVRFQAANQQQAEDFKNATQAFQQADKLFPQDPESVRQGAVALAAQVNNELTKTRAESALEEQTVAKIQDLASTGNVVQARLLMQNLQFPTAESVIRDMNVKQAIVQREIEKARVADQDQPWFSHLASFALGVLPLYQSGAQSDNVPVEAAAKGWMDWLMSGNRLQQESASLWNMPAPQFAQFVNQKLIPTLQKQSTTWGFYDHDKELSILSKLAKPPAAWETNTNDALNNLGWVPVGGAFKMARAMVGLGARAEATNLIAQAAQRLAQGATEDGVMGLTKGDVEAGLSHDALNPEAVFKQETPMPDGTTGTEVPTAGGATAAIEKGKSIWQTLSDAMSKMKPEGLSPEELQGALKSADEKFGVFDRQVQNFGIKTDTLEDGSKMNYLQGTYGTRDGTGFSSDRAARAWVNQNGYTLGSNAEILTDTSGQKFARLTVPVDERGLYTKELTNNVTNPIQRFLAGARQNMDVGLFSDALMASNGKAQLQKIMQDAIRPTFAKLDPNSFDYVRQALEYQTQNGKWLKNYEIDQLWNEAFKRPPTQAELDAMQSYRDFNDLAYYMRNSEQWRAKTKMGMQAVSFKSGLGVPVDGENAIIQNTFKGADASKERIFNVTDATHYHADNPLTPTEAQRLQDSGYKLVTLEDPIKLADDTYVRKFAIQGKDMNSEGLRFEQVPYAEGGTRQYADKYFVKQAVYGAQRDTGERVLMNPKTWVTAGTKEQANAWANAMEAARNAFNDGHDVGTIDDILRNWEAADSTPNGLRLPTGQEFHDMMTAGDLEHATPFEALYDRQMPTDYLDNRVNKSFVSEDQSPATSIERMQKLYYGPKGETLTNWQGNFSQIIDPAKALNDSLVNIASISSFSDFKEAAVNRWYSTYGKFLNAGDTGNALDAFMNGTFMKVTSDDRLPGIVNSGEAQRDAIKRILGWKSPSDVYQEQLSRRFAEWVSDSDLSKAVLPQNARNAISEGITNWATSPNAVKSLKGMAYDMKVGLFNIAHFPMRLGTMMAAISIDPLNGMKGMMTLMPLRAYLTKAGSDEMLNLLAERGIVDMAGFGSKEEFVDFMKSAKNSGFFHINFTHDLASSTGVNAAVSSLGDAADTARQAGRFFVNEGELWNRVVAWRIAWEQTRTALPKMTIDNPEFQRMLADRAETYSGNMSTASTAAWQRGIASIPTQFWSYNARMLELMAGKQLTGAQKMRLIVGQSLLYGGAGFPGMSMISDAVKQANGGMTPGNEDGTKSDLDTTYGALDRGLLDETIYHMTGVDGRFGERIGTGDWLPGLVKDVFGMSAYGQQRTVASMLGGVSGNNLLNVWKPLVDVARYAAAESGSDTGMPMTRDALEHAVEQISGAGNALKAMAMLKYGTYKTSTGTVLLGDDAPSSSAFAVALGFQPGKTADLEQMEEYLLDKRKAVEDAAKIIKGIRMSALSNPDEMDDAATKVNTIIKLLPEDVARQALMRTNRLMPTSIYAATANRIRREQAQSISIDSVINSSDEEQ